MSFKLPEGRDDLVEVALDGLNAIALAVSGATAGTAGGVLTVVRVILATLQEGFDDKITPERVREELAKLQANMTQNDAVADAAVDGKFDKG